MAQCGLEQPTKLTRKDFISDQDVRWCPGCGDYAILASIQRVMPELGVPREKIVFVSGIGCSSRFPYYMNTYGFHSIHGRAPAVATGIKLTRPDLMVWVVTGDGDGLSIGGNHLIHTMRRNIDLKILLFNNRIYGLTKGQTSPTSEQGMKTKSTPFGALDRPFNPLSVAIGSSATFVARSIDIDSPHLQYVLRRAAEHKGTAFVELYQNCNVFNDGTWESVTDKDVRSDRLLVLEHGKPLVFGKERKKGIRMRPDMSPEVVEIDGNTSGLLVHDERRKDEGYHFMLSRLASPEFPEPIGVLRAVREPTYEELMAEQAQTVIQRQSKGNIEKLLHTGETWVVS
ncbi:2-oxoacid ferredoxin oxidoreductase subunit beta [Candidatus Methylomirabilis lanthanidiphila]|uniref:2-oxoacid ferredoxin oxidoreductase subunit beta n=1 Tax=Candidatus Methylomirabilis lanthanidiphila TaxID=2211376 RepID=A0A564ZNM3_9BACT|nr:2-oxoacid:ferredoxin oxidoreductase subunit beta [Candidatus Methylomirabilis lanthanidiphila]VUZ86138.1 2-oxoacid ferredoxin oxidoreductase subunit beta [Candidatus Methylomirabilis lanthanidiphila]